MNEPLVTSPIRITYRETADHVMEAMEQAKRPSPVVAEWVQNLFITLLVLGGVTMALVEQYRKGVDRKILVLGSVCTLLVVGFWLCVFKWAGFGKGTKRSRRHYEKWYRKHTGRDTTKVVCEFGELGLLVTGEDGVATHHPWASIVRVLERPRGLLIYVGPEVFHWFPKSFFASETDYVALVELIRSKQVKLETADAGK